MARIAEATGDTVFLTQRSGLDAVCVDRQEGTFPIKTFTLEIGMRRPLGVGTGSLAILSALSEEEIQAIVNSNPPRYGIRRLRRDPARAGQARAEARLRDARNADARGRALGRPCAAQPERHRFRRAVGLHDLEPHDRKARARDRGAAEERRRLIEKQLGNGL